MVEEATLPPASTGSVGATPVNIGNQASPNPGVRVSGDPTNPPGLPKITEWEPKGLPRKSREIFKK